MNIAITTRRVADPIHHEQRDLVSSDWTHFLYDCFSSSSLVIPVVNYPSKVEYMAESIGFDAIILSNGNDLGECPERDETEFRLVTWAINKSIPVLGACRGFQFLNHFFNGSLHSSIADVSTENHAGCTHKVNLLNSSFCQIAQSDHLMVNSYHDMGITVDALSSELVPFACTENNVVEGFFHPSLPIIGIQWHPERPSPSAQFDALLIKHFFSNQLCII